VLGAVDIGRLVFRKERVTETKQEEEEHLTTTWRILTHSTSVPNAETESLTNVDSSKNWLDEFHIFQSFRSTIDALELKGHQLLLLIT